MRFIIPDVLPRFMEQLSKTETNFNSSVPLGVQLECWLGFALFNLAEGSAAIGAAAEGLGRQIGSRHVRRTLQRCLRPGARREAHGGCILL